MEGVQYYFFRFYIIRVYKNELIYKNNFSILIACSYDFFFFFSLFEIFSCFVTVDGWILGWFLNFILVWSQHSGLCEIPL